MNTIRKLMSPIERKALKSLELFEQIKDLTAVLELHKEDYREVANGDTLDIIVEGVGKVQVKKPSEGGTFTSTSFDLKAFDLLDKKTQHELISKGVVKITTASKAPSKAAVVFTLNV